MAFYKFFDNGGRLLQSYLKKNSTSKNGELSAVKNNKYGVPQGLVLGPFLFWINDIGRCASEADAVLFADDTVFLNYEHNIEDITPRVLSVQENASAWL